MTRPATAPAAAGLSRMFTNPGPATCALSIPGSAPSFPAIASVVSALHPQDRPTAQHIIAQPFEQKAVFLGDHRREFRGRLRADRSRQDVVFVVAAAVAKPAIVADHAKDVSEPLREVQADFAGFAAESVAGGVAQQLRHDQPDEPARPSRQQHLFGGHGQADAARLEVRGRELVLYWRDLAPEQKIEVSVDLVCRIPGEYSGPASRAYLYYNADRKFWAEPLHIAIRPEGE